MTERTEQPPVVDSSWKPPMINDRRRRTYITVIVSATVILVVVTITGLSMMTRTVDGTPKPVVAVALPSTPPAAPTVTVTAPPPPPVAAEPTTTTATPAIPRAGFFGEWGMHGMSVTLAPDGSAIYMAWLGTPIGVSWSATWSPMTSTTAMIVLTTQTESHGGAAQRSLYTPEGLTWIDGHSGQALAFTLRGDGYATVQNPLGKLVTLCPNPADFHGTKMLCGA